MKLSNLLQSKRLAKYVSTFGVAAAALLIGTASVSAQANCREIQGRYHEQAVAPADCTTSPVGLCITANYTNGNNKHSNWHTKTCCKHSSRTNYSVTGRL